MNDIREYVSFCGSSVRFISTLSKAASDDIANYRSS